MFLHASNYCFVTKDSESDYSDIPSFSSNEKVNSVSFCGRNIQQASAGSSSKSTEQDGAGGSSKSTKQASAGSLQDGPSTCARHRQGAGKRTLK